MPAPPSEGGGEGEERGPQHREGLLVGGGVGSAVIGGLGEALGITGSLLVLGVVPLIGLLALVPELRAAAEPTD